MELKYTPRTIREIEDVARKPITDVIADVSNSNTFLLVRKGLNVSEEDTDKAIESYLAEEKNDMISLHILCMEVMQKMGFLPRALKIQEIRKNLEKLSV